MNDIIKALGEPFFSGMLSCSIRCNPAEPLPESAVQLFIEALTQELKENRWALYAEAGVMSDRDLIVWDQQFLEKIESKLSGVLAIALPERSPGDLQVISFRLVRHWKNYMRILIEYDERQDTSWLAKDMIHTSMALIEAKIV